MKISRPILILVAAIGAYHIVLLKLNPYRLPPRAKAEVIWGDLSNQQPSSLPNPLINTAFCPGTLQPSIDNNVGASPVSTDNRVRFEYRPEADYFVHTDHAEEIVMEPGSTITIDKTAYELKQILFQNSGSDGRIELTLIHHAEDGKIAVVTAPLQISKENNPAIDILWRYMPLKIGEHNSLDDIHVDINNLLPHDRTYYRYAASGTCSKDIVWLGLKSPIEITADQMAKLRQALATQNTSTPS